ncbi:MAG: flagellar basal body-associated protein FliL [Pyrinomonadaceae bacterium]
MSENEQEIISAEEATPNEGKKKRGKKLIIIIAIVFLLAGAGGGGFYYWRASRMVAAETASKKANDKKSHADKETDDPNGQADPKAAPKASDPLQNALPNDEEVKKIIELPSFIVNLADTEQARYLRMTVSLGIDGEVSEKPDQLFMTRVRNAMLAVLSDKKSEEILSVEGKTKLRKELLQAARAASEDPEVKAIYITDFIVQL